MSNAIGTHLGRYEIVAEIGRGAMGLVYQAHDPKIDRLVAIKTISLQSQEIEEEQEFRERFFLEARAAGRLVHPGIVTIFDVGEDLDTHEPYIVMEFVTGQPLNRILSGENRKLPLGPVLQITQEIAEALNYAHSQNVIHRDIKPANILMTIDGHAKIADFGIAKVSHGLMTLPGQVLGSPAYMAPEQLSGETADARSDLFSLGVILYSMLTGFRPFQGNSAATVSFKVVNRDPLPVTSFDSEFPTELDRLVSKAIAKEPAQRYQSGAEMAQEIQRLRERYNLNDYTAATLEFVTNPPERTTIIRGPSRFGTPRPRSTESSTQNPTHARSTESSTQAATRRPRSTESSTQAGLQPRSTESATQGAPPRPQAAQLSPDGTPVGALPVAAHTGTRLWPNAPIFEMVPKEILLTAASVLVLALVFIGFEALHVRKANRSAVAVPSATANMQDAEIRASQIRVDAEIEKAASSDDAQAAPVEPVAPKEIKIKPVKPKKPAQKLQAQATANLVALAKTAPATPPVKPVVPADTATLQIQIEYQFSEVDASVWLDNQVVYSQKLFGEEKKKALLFKKVQGREHSNVKVPAGQHSIHVRVVSEADQYDQSQDIAGNFVANSQNVLTINCDKHAGAMQLELQ